MEKLEPSYTAGGNRKWYRLCGRQPDSSSSGLIIKFPYDLTIPLLGVYLKENICPYRNVYTYVYSIFNHNSQRGKDQMAINW